MIDNQYVENFNPKVVFNDAYMALLKLTNLNDVKITKSSIRKYISEIKSFPSLTLYDMVELIVKCGGTPKVQKKSVTELSDLHFPAIGHLSKDGKNGSYITVVEANDDTITFWGSDNEVSIRKVSELAQKWSGLAITVHFDADYQDPDYLFSTEMELKEEADYKKNIRLTENFLSPDECREVIDFCESESLFRPSLVEDLGDTEKKATESDMRTSFSAVINVNVENQLIKNIYQRASELCDVKIENIENIQCVRYATGQEFEKHFDGDSINNRFKTLLVYLNEDFEGGETYFPEIDVKIVPKTGLCLEFDNLDAERDPLIMSMHCGQPVISGKKYALNIWLQN